MDTVNRAEMYATGEKNKFLNKFLLPLIAISLLIALGFQMYTVAEFGEVTAVPYENPNKQTETVVEDAVVEDAVVEDTTPVETEPVVADTEETKESTETATTESQETPAADANTESTTTETNNENTNTNDG